MPITEASGRDRFWIWPWILGAAVLHFRINGYLIDEAPTPWNLGRYVWDFFARYGDALAYLTFFVAAVFVHRYRFKTKNPVTVYVVIACVIMFVMLKTQELEACLVALAHGRTFL